MKWISHRSSEPLLGVRIPPGAQIQKRLFLIVLFEFVHVWRGEKAGLSPDMSEANQDEGGGVAGELDTARPVTESLRVHKIL